MRGRIPTGVDLVRKLISFIIEVGRESRVIWRLTIENFNQTSLFTSGETPVEVARCTSELLTRLIQRLELGSLLDGRDIKGRKTSHKDIIIPSRPFLAEDPPTPPDNVSQLYAVTTNLFPPTDSKWLCHNIFVPEISGASCLDIQLRYI